MKKILVISILIFLGVCANAQIASKHVLELSTGYPEIVSSIYPPGNLDNPATARAEKNGQKREGIVPLNFTLSYAYRVLNHWDIGVRFNTRSWVYKSSQYPAKGTGYDWNADPLSTETKIENRGIATSLFGRYYWLMNDSYQLYSSAGVGVHYLENDYRLEPDLIPIGYHFGNKRIYGILELSLGTVGTGLVFGIGCRL